MKALAQAIYQTLEAFTGDIEAFLSARRDETWQSEIEGYLPFVITATGERQVSFGFYKDFQGNVCGDPMISLSLEKDTARLDTLVTHTLLGSFHGPEEENAQYCADFLAEILTRKNNGLITLQGSVEHV